MFSTTATALLSLLGATMSLFASLDAALLAQVSSVASTQAIVANVAPTVESLTIAGNQGAPSSTFERTITFTGFADDENGDQDLTNVSLVAWRDGNPLGAACSSDPNHCYRVSPCTIDVNTGTDTEVWYYCSFSIPQAYAYGNWQVRITATDADAATGIREETFPIDAFVFEPPVTPEEPESGSTLIGSMPQEPAVSPITTPGTQTGGTPQTGTPPEGTSSGTTAAGADCIAAFYARMEKPEPSIRRALRHTEACSDSLRVASRDSGLLVFDISDGVAPTKTTTRAVTIELAPGASKTWLTLRAQRRTTEDYPL